MIKFDLIGFLWWCDCVREESREKPLSTSYVLTLWWHEEYQMQWHWW